LPLLEALRHDETKYVQDSVANWMNDASKDSPTWVRSVVRSWQKEASKRENAKALRRICTRAMRTLEKNQTEDAAPKQPAKRAAEGKKVATKSARAKQGTAASRNGRAKNIRE
jgi:3-methyladenine DNA glycosylase AlkC